ncbi:MAG: AAA family ATPase [Pseudomonadota bacterium]|nr:AAA family ATPase [Pseudomonadota bacterium]
MMSLRAIAATLGGDVSGSSVLAPGPGHSKCDRSLSVTPLPTAPDGFLVHSFCGDDPIACKDYVREKTGRPAFEPNGHAKPAAKTYFDYHNEAGALVYQVERTDYCDGRKKTFRQRRPDGNGGWLWNLGGIRPVPYRLPELIEAVGNENPIVIAEGERKVDLLRSWNIPATCNSGGAQKWRAEHSAYLSGADVVILPDNDQAGRSHVDAVAVSLSEVGAIVRVLDLPDLPPKGDVIDWAAAGGTAEQLHALIENEAGPWEPSGRDSVNASMPAPKKPPSRVIGAGTFMQSYVPISYTLGGTLPSGYLYGLTAKQGSGKTAWKIAATIAVAMNRPDVIGCAVEPGRVAYVSIENPTDFKMKLAVNCYAHNVSYDEIESRVAIIDGRDTPEQIFEGLKLDAEANGAFQLVCFDTFQAGFAAAGAGAFNDNEAVLGYVIRLRPLTTLPGSPSVLVAFHPTKNAGEGELIPYGGGSTYNEIDGNLTLWKDAQIKLYHNRLRGPEFEPKYFRIEILSCPDIVDKQNRQILLPVMRPITDTDAEECEKNNGNLDFALLRAMAANREGSQTEWAFAIGIKAKSSINKKLQKLKIGKFVEEGLGGKWRLTPKGQKEATP